MTRPTTAIPAAPSATSSRTASTTRAASSMRRAISRTGGRPQDAKAFEDRINCQREQYAGYIIVDDIHINSKLTSGEDVADLGGTLLAYIAWKKETAGQSSAVKRRLHSRSALLHRLCPVGLRESAAGKSARLRYHQSAFARQGARQRYRDEHAGVRNRLWMQSGPADGQGESLQGLVAARVRRGTCSLRRRRTGIARRPHGDRRSAHARGRRTRSPASAASIAADGNLSAMPARREIQTPAR